MHKFIKISEDSSANEQAICLVKKMNEFRKEQEVKKNKELGELEKSLLMHKQQMIKEKEDIIKRYTEEKRKKIEENIASIELRKEQRFKRLASQKKVVEELLRNDSSFETPELDRRKKELALKRKLETAPEGPRSR